MSEMTQSGSNPTLAQQILCATAGKNRYDAEIKGISLHRWDQPTEPTSYMLAPSICLIGQGRKRLFLGDEAFIYDSEQFLITSLELPVISQILEASEDAPYLGITMELDLHIISQLMVENQAILSPRPADNRGVAVGTLSPALLGAFERLLLLLDTPADIPALAPLIEREIYYRLLQSEQGARLRGIVSSGNHSHQIAQAINWLKDNFSKPIKVEEMADYAGLSVSAFHSHFRAMTAMSPLQFQKKIRLSEARRLMLAENLDASKAAYEVGYESPSQFSREYRRMFGAPPMKDIRMLSNGDGAR